MIIVIVIIVRCDTVAIGVIGCITIDTIVVNSVIGDFRPVTGGVTVVTVGTTKTLIAITVPVIR